MRESDFWSKDSEEHRSTLSAIFEESEENLIIDDDFDCDNKQITKRPYFQTIEARILIPKEWKCNHVPKKSSQSEWKKCFDASKIFSCKKSSSKRITDAAQRECKSCGSECKCSIYDAATSPYNKKWRGNVDDWSDDEEETVALDSNFGKTESELLREQLLRDLEAGLGGDGNNVEGDGSDLKGGDGKDGDRKDGDGKDGDGKADDDDGLPLGICATPCTLKGSAKNKLKIPCSKVMTTPCTGKCARMPGSECKSIEPKRSKIPVRIPCKPTCERESSTRSKKKRKEKKADSRRCKGCGNAENPQTTQMKIVNDTVSENNDCTGCIRKNYVVQTVLLEIPLGSDWLDCTGFTSIDLTKFSLPPNLLSKFGYHLIEFRSRDLVKFLKHEFVQTFGYSPTGFGRSEFFNPNSLLSLIAQKNLKYICAPKQPGLTTPTLMDTEEKQIANDTEPKIPHVVEEDCEEIELNLYDPYSSATTNDFGDTNGYENIPNEDDDNNVDSCSSFHEFSSSDASDYEDCTTESCDDMRSADTWNFLISKPNEEDYVTVSENLHVRSPKRQGLLEFSEAKNLSKIVINETLEAKTKSEDVKQTEIDQIKHLDQVDEAALDTALSSFLVKQSKLIFETEPFI